MKQFKLSDLVDDAAGEEGWRFLAVCVEVERHQSIRPHREVVVHGQNLRRTCSVCFIRTESVSVGQLSSIAQGLNNNISARKD